jgi:hypothetical protein
MSVRVQAGRQGVLPDGPLPPPSPGAGCRHKREREGLDDNLLPMFWQCCHTLRGLVGGEGVGPPHLGRRAHMGPATGSLVST